MTIGTVSMASQANSCSRDMCDPISHQPAGECLTAEQEVFLEEDNVQASPMCFIQLVTSVGLSSIDGALRFLVFDPLMFFIA